MKKIRIITNTSSLFAIPLNDEFVFVSEDPPKDQLSEAIKGLILDCQPGGAMQVEAPFSSEPYLGKEFFKFLLVHVQQAKTKGFNDSVSSSRHQHIPSHFEVCNNSQSEKDCYRKPSFLASHT